MKREEWATGLICLFSLGSTLAETRIRLQTFTYPDADYATKLAAFKEGVLISKSILDSLLPEYNETRLIEEDKRENWQRYQFIPGYEQRARLNFRQRYASLKSSLRRQNMKTLAKDCPRRCSQFLRANFTAPSLGSANASEASQVLEDAGMAPFSAHFLALPLEEMFAVQEENCAQWEAKWQCLYGCLQDLSLIQSMKRQLTGDEHLSVNIECPDPRFLINLPCLADNIGDVAGGCSKPFDMYRRQREAALNETAEIVEDLGADGKYKERFARVMGVSSRFLAAMEVRDKQRNICALYHSFLTCAITGMKRACNERAASFFHTSVVANFLQNILPERLSVERIIGTIPAQCEFLVQKAAYGLLPIEHEKD